ncbi:MAG: alpha-hydroxyketone-type quorum-sensing autoinducer synthase [Pseudomonadota bacterium]
MDTSSISFDPQNIVPFESDSLPRVISEKFYLQHEKLFSHRKNEKHLVLGKKPSSQSLILQSNDYLCLAKHPKIVNAQVNALLSSHNDLIMSAVFLHEGSLKDRFEKKMAEYIGFEKAILTQSGWMANTGLLQVIADETIPVYIDFFAHMSLWEGVFTAKAKAYPFKHNSADNLEKLIKKHGAGIIVVDSVYSTTGSVAPLIDIVHLAHQYDCVIVVDESHSLGTHGPSGAGLVAELNLTDKVHFITASLAKAFAGRAGIIFCNEQVAHCFPYVSRPSIFSSTLFDHEIAALSATLEIIRDADDRRQTLHKNARYLRQGLNELGFNIESQSQIVSLASGAESNTEQLRDALENKDIFGSVFCSPATPKNRSLVRFSINSGLTQYQLDVILSACATIRDELKILNWRSFRQKSLYKSAIENVSASSELIAE